MSIFSLAVIEVRRVFQTAWSYRFNLLADQFFFIIGFLLVTGVFELATNGRFTPAAALASMIGWLVWRAAGGCMRDVSGSIAEDAQMGTLEQIWLSGSHPASILLARCGALVVYYSGRVLIMAAIIMPLLGLAFNTDRGAWLLAPIVYTLTLVGVFGLVFVIAGLHLVYKNVEAITYAVATTLLFLTGAIVSFEGLHNIFVLSRLLPLSIGLDLLRDLLINHRSAYYTLLSANFIGLVLNTTCYFLIGLLVLNWAQKKALIDGSLAHY